MFFEDEKDFIENPAEIHIDEDGTVSWDAVLNDSDEDLISIKSEPTQAPKRSNIKGDVIGLGDELELVNVDDDDDAGSDEQLAQILGHDIPSIDEIPTKAPVAPGIDNFSSDNSSEELVYESFEDDSDNLSGDDFDIDKQLSSVVLEQNRSEDVPQPRKEEAAKKSSAGIMPLLLIVLILALGGGVYYYISEYMGSQDLDNDQILPPPTKVQEMNNMQKEDIAQRAEENAQKKMDENIPVVNEENAQEVKPEEEQKEEKKEVISVKSSGGRSNPFLPSEKYASSEIPVAEIDFDSSGIPKPPEEYGIKEDITNLVSISVSGIMYDEIKPSAIITYQENDYFVQKGDRLDEFKVVEIARNYVAISQGSNIYRANIGESFQIDSVDGSAKYMPAAQGGGRQYYSANYKQNYERKLGDRRYVSEQDIKVNAR